MNLEKVKNKIPKHLKRRLKAVYNLAPVKLRYGYLFRQQYNFLKASVWWDEVHLQKYQMEQLTSLLKHCYNNVPYYTQVFNERKLKPEDIKTISDLSELPILTKDIIRQNYKDLMAKNINKSDLITVKTSGSTASPLTFHWQKSLTLPTEHAFIWTIYNIVGYQFNDKRLDLTPNRIDEQRRILSISDAVLDDITLKKYIDKINEFRPKVIKSIPSVFVALADYIQKTKPMLSASVKILICGSETIYPWQRNLIESAFGCRLFTFYGQSERVILATECELSDKYHVFPQYGITELLDPRDLSQINSGRKGKLVGTGFNNYAIPFIRYDVGDIAEWHASQCKCGRHFKLLKRIEGRENEYLVDKNGKLIPMISFPYSKIMKNVRQFQFYQDSPGQAILRIAPLPEYTKADESSVIDNIKQDMENIIIKLQYVDNIERTRAGKYKYIIQKLPVQHSNSDVE